MYRALGSDHGTTCPCSALSRVPHRSRAAYRPQPPLHQLQGCPCVSHSCRAPSGPFIRWFFLASSSAWIPPRAGCSCGSPGLALFLRFHFAVVSPYRRSLTLFVSSQRSVFTLDTGGPLSPASSCLPGLRRSLPQRTLLLSPLLGKRGGGVGL